MFFTTHLCVGALLGTALRSPAIAGVAGLASHVALDSVPHWGNPDERTFLRVARVDGLTALAVAAALLRALPASRRSVAAAMAGAGLLDLDKPCRHFFGASPFPRRVDDFHVRIQQGRETPRRWPVDLATTVVAGRLLQRQRQP